MRRLPCYHSVVLEVGGASWLGQVYSSFHIVLGVIEGHLLQRVMSHVINLSEGHIATSPPNFLPIKTMNVLAARHVMVTSWKLLRSNQYSI